MSCSGVQSRGARRVCIWRDCSARPSARTAGSSAVGDRRPWRTQRVLSHVLWDQDKARDLCRGYVVEHLGAPDGVLIIDETGFLKKGTRSAGVARQYSGTAGRVENCQIGVFLAYASGKGHALIDRELYLPKEWTDDRERCTAAAVPEAVEFATKPRLAQRMIERALTAGVPVSWVLGDEVSTAGCASGWSSTTDPMCWRSRRRCGRWPGGRCRPRIWRRPNPWRAGAA